MPKITFLLKKTRLETLINLYWKKLFSSKYSGYKAQHLFLSSNHFTIPAVSSSETSSIYFRRQFGISWLKIFLHSHYLQFWWFIIPHYFPRSWDTSMICRKCFNDHQMLLMADCDNCLYCALHFIQNGINSKYNLYNWNNFQNSQGNIWCIIYTIYNGRFTLRNEFA